MTKLKVGSLFSGIKAPEKALLNIGMDFEVEFSSEWDIYAAVAGNQVHNNGKDVTYPSNEEMREHLLQFTWSKDGKKPCSEGYIKRMKGEKLKGLYKAQIQSNNLGDIRELVDMELPKVDLIIHGSPCQDFSLSGLNKGGDESSGTRSSLMWHTVNVVSKVNPKYILWENVKGVLSKKHKHNFKNYLKKLEDLGYKNHHKVLDASDFGIPQSRERVFVVSVREDIRHNFSFPQEKKLGKTLNNILEENVEEKYYLDKEFEVLNKINKNNQRKLDQVAKLNIKGRDSIKRIYNPSGLAPTLTSMGGGHREPKIMQSRGVCNQNRDAIEVYKIGAYRGRYNEDGSTSQQLEIRDDYITNTLTTVQKDNYVIEDYYKVRKLTPLECWKLMGFDNQDYYKAKDEMEKVFYYGNDRSDTRLYKAAGNSIVVPVLEELFKTIFDLE